VAGHLLLETPRNGRKEAIQEARKEEGLLLERFCTKYKNNGSYILQIKAPRYPRRITDLQVKTQKKTEHRNTQVKNCKGVRRRGDPRLCSTQRVSEKTQVCTLPIQLATFNLSISIRYFICSYQQDNNTTRRTPKTQAEIRANNNINYVP